MCNYLNINSVLLSNGADLNFSKNCHWLLALSARNQPAPGPNPLSSPLLGSGNRHAFVSVCISLLGNTNHKN